MALTVFWIILMALLVGMNLMITLSDPSVLGVSAIIICSLALVIHTANLKKKIDEATAIHAQDLKVETRVAPQIDTLVTGRAGSQLDTTYVLHLYPESLEVLQ